MKWQIVSVGKPALPWAKAGIEDYTRRLRRSAQVDFVVLKEGTPDQVAERTLEASKDSWRIVLDEKGKHLTSKDLSGWIAKQELSGRKRVSFLIGGADGHAASVKAAADELWCLSAMTLQHEVALLLMLEQIYRGYSILRGDPYHRE
ncbi:MAG: 23S rRNA (pseudouridine(1915)-N(3))-methyltransferase RlmH [Verrucomicrobium sp.]|nr:23S rRNA (pseudouridine(1915)-N(3))-methyltransferase RlmH [Verrucomicrobium sp.]